MQWYRWQYAAECYWVGCRTGQMQGFLLLSPGGVVPTARAPPGSDDGSSHEALPTRNAPWALMFLLGVDRVEVTDHPHGWCQSPASPEVHRTSSSSRPLHKSCCECALSGKVPDFQVNKDILSGGLRRDVAGNEDREIHLSLDKVNPLPHTEWILRFNRQCPTLFSFN